MVEKQLIHDVEIAYKIIGQGSKTILMLHGEGETMSVYDELASILSKKYKVVLMDSRGHGQSKLHGKPLSLELIKDDAIELMNKLNIFEYSIFGTGIGANVALMMGLENSKIESLILVSPALSFKAYKGFFKWTSYVRCFCLLPLCLYHPGARLEWKKQMLIMKKSSLTIEKLSQIKAPVLMFSGQFDLIKREHFENIAKNLCFCKYHVIKQASHYMIRPLDETLTKEVSLFLDCLD